MYRVTNKFPPGQVDDLRPGTRIGEYEVREVIGRGGMGIVYRAVHREIGSEVAIKVLPGDWTGPEARSADRFIQEAKAACRVRHINIVQVFSFGHMDDGGLYYVMEHLDGVSLGRYLAKVGPLDLRTTVIIVKALASALDLLHASSVVHRDLKPDNVFLVRPDLGISEAQVKLLDFGVARLLDARPGNAALTQTSVLVGTPAYMSPEQCRGKPAGPRSDIYGLGVMSFELLSGQHPYTAQSTGDLAVKQETGDRASLRELVPALPAELDEHISRAMCTDPAGRFHRAGDFARALASVGETEEKPGAAAPSGWYSARLPRVVVAASLALGLGAVIVFFMRGDETATVEGAAAVSSDDAGSASMGTEPVPAAHTSVDRGTLTPSRVAGDAGTVSVNLKRARTPRKKAPRRFRRPDSQRSEKKKKKKDQVVRDMPVRL